MKLLRHPPLSMFPITFYHFGETGTLLLLLYVPCVYCTNVLLPVCCEYIVDLFNTAVTT
jgi:hypothetical protein